MLPKSGYPGGLYEGDDAQAISLSSSASMRSSACEASVRSGVEVRDESEDSDIRFGRVTISGAIRR